MDKKIQLKKLFFFTIIGIIFLYFGFINSNLINQNNNSDQKVLTNNLDQKIKINSKSENNSQIIFEYGLYSNNGVSFYFFENGSIYVWGNNNYGQTGTGPLTGSSIDSPLLANDYLGFDATEIIYFTIGSYGNTVYTFLDNGDIYVWGRNHAGQLGLGDNTDRDTPQLANTSWGMTSLDISEFYLRGWTPIVFKNSGEIWAWGRNNNGQLGIGTTVAEYTPTQVDDNWLFDASDIDTLVLMSHSVYVFLNAANNNDIYVWGRNSDGQLGLNHTTTRTVPTLATLEWGFDTSQVESMYFIEYSSFGPTTLAYNIVFLNNGEIWGWGDNAYSPLGTGAASVITSPIQLDTVWNTYFDTTLIIDFDSNYYTSFVFLSNGEIWGWGLNENGQLGINHTTNIINPVLLNNDWWFDANDVDTFVISNGSSYTFLTDGSIYVWGDNQEGQLGIGNRTAALNPVYVNNIWGFGGYDIYEIKYDNYLSYNYLILNNGSFYGWGNNDTMNYLGIDNYALNLTVPNILFQFANFEYIWSDDDLEISVNYDKQFWGDNDLYYTLYNVTTGVTEVIPSTLVPNLIPDGTLTSFTISNIIGLNPNDIYELHFTPNPNTDPVSPGFLLKSEISLEGAVTSVDAKEVTKDSATIEYFYTYSYQNMSGISQMQYSLDNGNNWIPLADAAVSGVNTFEITNLDPLLDKYTIMVSPVNFPNNFYQSTFIKPTIHDSIISNVQVTEITSSSALITFSYDIGNNSTGNIQYSLNNEAWVTVESGLTISEDYSFTINNLDPLTSYTIVVVPEFEGLTFSSETTFTTSNTSSTPETTDSSSWWDNNAWWVILISALGGLLLGASPTITKYFKNLRNKNKLE